MTAGVAVLVAWSEVVAEPGRGAVEEVVAYVGAAVEHVTELLLAAEHPGERYLDPCHDREAALRWVGGGRVGVDRRHLEGQIGPADARELGGQEEQIRPVWQRRQRPGEEQGKPEAVWRVVVLRKVDDEVLEGEQRAGIDLERQVEVEWPSTGFLWVEVDLPRLAEGVRLDEVTLVVHVEAVVDCVILEVGDESGNVDGGHAGTSLPRARGPVRCPIMDDAVLLEVLHEAATAVRTALDGLTDWGSAGTRSGQYLSDLAADDAAVGVIERAGLGVMSEESGLHGADRSIVVVLDPVDGSTNASRGLPWYATSLCAVDGDGARVALVVDQASGARFEAVRGAGARVDGVALRPTDCRRLDDAIVGLSGYPPERFGWKQFRALGAAALDLCAVAAGRLDAFVDCSPSAHGSWDYLGGLLVCQEAGAVVADAFGRPLLTLDHDARRTPVAAATPELLAEALGARRRFADHALWAEERPLI